MTIRSLLYNRKIRSVVFQILLLVGVFVFGVFIYHNTVSNLATRGIITSFDFLNQVAGFQIAFSPFLDYELGVSTYFDVFWIGLLNTILVSLLGIIIATFLGVIVGCLRVSDSWIAQKIASAYIEILRNIPLLLHIMFWYFIIFLNLLPPPRESFSLFNLFFLNTSGLILPEIGVNSTIRLIIFCFFIASLVVGCYFFNKWAKNQLFEFGRVIKVFRIIFFGLIFVILSLILVLQPFSFSSPELGTFIFTSGITVPLSLFALGFVLSIYTSAFIAENVRAGIISVTKGQKEAAKSLGLRQNMLLKLVILPQALKVIIPPTISQFLNLTKNSSLAVAISYEEIVNLFSGITLNNTGQAVIIMAMTFFVFQVLSLSTSFLINKYNQKNQLVHR